LIIVKLMGGLGNQMFQYAAARRLAHHHGVELKLDLSFLEENTEVITRRKYELGHLNITAAIATRAEVAEYTRKPRHVLARILDRCTGRTESLPSYIREASFDFWPGLLEAPDNSYLDGYWQSDRYFRDIGGLLREEFQVVTAQDQWNKEMVERITGENAVSLHVRRGDYVSDKATSEFHGTCSLKYYHDAVTAVTGSLPSPTFFVFSDDQAWVKANLGLPKGTVYMDHNPPDKGCEDLRLMKLCRHFIIANSSFSWWGAWLGNAPEKMVIAPRNWFNSPGMNTDDLLPVSWCRL